MQTNYDIDVAEESNHEDNNNLPEFVDSECCSPQQLLLQNHHHRYSLHHYNPNQPVQPWQYRASEQERVLKLSCYYQSQLPQVLNFKLGLNQNSTTSATATGSANNNNNNAVQVHHQFYNHNHYFPEKQTHYVPKNRRQAEEYSIPKEPFCFADNNSKDSYSLNELDAIYNLAKISDNNNDIIIDSKLSEKKKKKKRKRRRRKEVILLSSMSRFFKGLVEKIVSHQDRLHESFLESMDRMERERIKREEEWKIEEARWHSREAIARVHEQAQALNREEVIVSHIETITGQRLNFPI